MEGGTFKAKTDSNLNIKNRDPRPLHDGKFQDRACKKIAGFFKQYGIQANIRTAKGFWELIAQSMRLLVSSQLQKDRINSLLDFLKELKYPFRVNKMALENIESLTSLSTTIGILIWLVELLIVYNKECARVRSTQTDNFTANYCLKAYGKFMRGKDHSGEREAVVDSIKNKQKETDSRIDGMIAEMKDLT